MKRKGLAGTVFLALCITMFCFLGSHLLFAASKTARPSTPPPKGKVWVKLENGWRLVLAPPSDAPYAWVKDQWERITDIPLGKERVPSYWGDSGWMPAHWCPVIYPDPEAKWVSGHWESESKWVSGHWEMTPEVRTRVHRVWVPGHRGPRGKWYHGFWK